MWINKIKEALMLVEGFGGVRMVINGTKIIDTNHSVEQFIERTPKAGPLLDKMFPKILSYLKANAKPSVEEYLFFSKSANLGVVIAYRKEKPRYATDNKRHIAIITVLPFGKSRAREGTPKVVIESFLLHPEHLMGSTEVNLVENLQIEQQILQETLESDSSYTTYKITENLSLVLVDGKAYNFFGDTEIIQLD